MKDFKYTWRWLRDPQRKVLDAPFKHLGIAFLVVWAILFYFSLNLMLALYYELAWLGAWALYVLVTKTVKRFKSVRESGLDIPWWKVLFNVFKEPNTFGAMNEKWELVCEGRLERGKDKRIPKLYNHQILGNGSTRAMVSPGKIGGDLTSIVSLAIDTIPAVMDCHSVMVQEVKPGTAWLTFHKKDPFHRPVSVLDLPISGLDSYSFGYLEDGDAATIPMGAHVLISAASGAGKSKFWWDMFFDLVRDGVHTELVVIDPKRMELARFQKWVGKKIGNVKVIKYMRTAKEAAEYFATFKEEMHDRQDILGEGGELTEPTEEMPQRLIVIDEGLDIEAAWKKDQMTSDFGIILSQGRGSRDHVHMLTQVATIQEIGGIRKGFNFRVSLRQGSAADTMAILGIPESEGVPCSKIPFASRGVGYYVTDEGKRAKFRTCDPTKYIEPLMTTGELPKNMIRRDLVEEHHAPLRGLATKGKLHDAEGFFVYVGMDFPKPGDILDPDITYVGKTKQLPRNRFKQHKTAPEGTADWKYCEEHGRVENFWNVHVDPRTIQITSYPTEAAMDAAESRMIEGLMPRFNVVDNNDNPRANNQKQTGVPNPRPRPRRRQRPVSEPAAVPAAVDPPEVLVEPEIAVQPVAAPKRRRIVSQTEDDLVVEVKPEEISEPEVVAEPNMVTEGQVWPILPQDAYATPSGRQRPQRKRVRAA